MVWYISFENKNDLESHVFSSCKTTRLIRVLVYIKPSWLQAEHSMSLEYVSYNAGYCVEKYGVEFMPAHI